jgi:hypothetical protein
VSTPPIPAATTLLVRDGAGGLEVFLVERHRQIEFAEGGAAARKKWVSKRDGEESVDSLWATPAAAVRLGESGRRTIIFPTLMNLRKLGRSRSVAEALERARREPVVTVLPRAERGPDGAVVRIPPEAGYDVSVASVDRLGGPRPA